MIDEKVDQGRPLGPRETEGKVGDATTTLGKEGRDHLRNLRELSSAVPEFQLYKALLISCSPPMRHRIAVSSY